MAPTSIAIVGPTASGKTARAVAVASHFGGDVISADSRQVYRGMSIGTGKDLEEYGDVPVHLIDVAAAGEKYNLFRYLDGFHKVYSKLISGRRLPVICGGSGMYVENALKGIRLPEVPRNDELRNRYGGLDLGALTEILKHYKTLHNKTDIDTRQRALRAIEIEEYYLSHPQEAALAKSGCTSPLDCLVIGIDIPRKERRERISHRLKARLDAGMAEEVRGLLNSGLTPESLIYYGLEYKFVTLFLIGTLSYDEMFSQLETAIFQFAKRQMTWFRGMEKRGIHVNWLPFDLSEEAFLDEVKRLYQINQMA